MKYSQKNIVRMILTGQKAMILVVIDVDVINTAYSGFHEIGYIVRLDDMREIFVREYELEDSTNA